MFLVNLFRRTSNNSGTELLFCYNLLKKQEVKLDGISKSRCFLERHSSTSFEIGKEQSSKMCSTVVFKDGQRYFVYSASLF